MIERPRLAAAVALVVVLLAGATGAVIGIVGPRHPRTASRTAADRECEVVAPTPRPERGPRLVARPVAVADQPTSVALWRDGRSGVLAERPGRLRAIEDGAIGAVVLDLTRDTADEGDGGLLAVVYDPQAPWLYALRTAEAQDDVLSAHRVDASGQPLPGEGRELLRVDRGPSNQHHGGGMAIDGDGLLYVGLGDGGGLGDPQENAQDRTSLLGKLLRIDPTPAGVRPYRIPGDNPAVDRHAWRPEIWALGLRNPYRVVLDGTTGAVWVGDVGHSCWEEVDRATTGANLGWDRQEGWAAFEGGDVVGGHLGPVLVRSHRDGWCAIVVGEGPSLPQLEGLLLVTDHCHGDLLGLDVTQLPAAPQPDLAPALRHLGLVLEAPTAIVPGPNGLPWALSLEGPILELSPAR